MRNSQYSLKFILHSGHFSMLQDMRQSFVSEPNKMSKAIFDHLRSKR
jgi:hypothetical protein